MKQESFDHMYAQKRCVDLTPITGDTEVKQNKIQLLQYILFVFTQQAWLVSFTSVTPEEQIWIPFPN